MTKAIRIHETGGPEKMVWEDYDVPEVGKGQIEVTQTAVGINYIDVYFRTGLYPSETSPFILGKEGAGVVSAVGEGVTLFKQGDRVAYCAISGTYAEKIVIDAEKAVKLPDAIDDKTAAAMMLKGTTAEYLLRRCFPVTAATTLLFHAAAGGVGLIVGQWAKHLGATTIGTAGSAEKCRLAEQNGYDHVINYKTEDFVARVNEITGGEKCDVVYDGVGKDTYAGSLDCLRRRGLFVTFGQSSGKIPDFDLNTLNKKGSLYATRPSLFNYNVTRAEFEASTKALFDVVASGTVKIDIGQTFPLEKAAEAHRALEARQTTGSTVLTIDS